MAAGKKSSQEHTSTYTGQHSNQFNNPMLRIRIRLFPDVDPDPTFLLIRIRIQIMLLINVMGICDHWSTYPPLAYIPSTGPF
jgi:hypothetical protein